MNHIPFQPQKSMNTANQTHASGLKRMRWCCSFSYWNVLFAGREMHLKSLSERNQWVCLKWIQYDSTPQQSSRWTILAVHNVPNVEATKRNSIEVQVAILGFTKHICVNSPCWDDFLKTVSPTPWAPGHSPKTSAARCQRALPDPPATLQKLWKMVEYWQCTHDEMGLLPIRTWAVCIHVHMYKCLNVKCISKIWILPETVSTPRVRTSWESSHCKAYKVPTWKWWPSDPKKCGCQIQSRYLSDEQHPNPQTSSVWTLALTDGALIHQQWRSQPRSLVSHCFFCGVAR